MTSTVKFLRSTTPGARPNKDPSKEGTLYVNFADEQIGFLDGAGKPKDFLAVRVFSALANYSADDMVAHSGKIYRAPGPIAAGAFSVAAWEEVGKAYVLPVATDTDIGGVKANIGQANEFVAGVAADGALIYDTPLEYVLPSATDTDLGGVIVGTPNAGEFVSGVAADGTLQWSAPPVYTLPVAATATIGGVKANAGTAGQFVTGVAADGALTYGMPAAYTLPIAKATALGGVKATVRPAGQFVTGIDAVGDLTFAALPAAYVLPAATDTVLGGVMATTRPANQFVTGIAAAGALAFAALPLATATLAGTVKATARPAGQFVTGIDATGDLTFAAPPIYTLPIAAAAALGGVKATANPGGEFVTGIDATGALTFATPNSLIGHTDPVNLTPTPSPAEGQYYIVNSATPGVVRAGWPGATGTTVEKGDLLVWDGAAWAHISGHRYVLPAPTAVALGGVMNNAGRPGQFVSGINQFGQLVYGNPASSLMGSIDPTTSTAPQTPHVGDYYFVNTAARGTVGPSWTGAATLTVQHGDLIIWDGAAWAVVGGSTYVLEAATATALGGVMGGAPTAGQFVTGIAADGTLTYATPAAFTLPTAAATTLGGVMVGAPVAGQFVSGVSANGTLQWSAPAAYTLPAATAAALGGVMATARPAGQFVTGVDATGALTFAAPPAYTLPAATAAALGGVMATAPVAGQFVTGIDVNGGLTFAAPAAYTLAAAQAAVLGGVMIGTPGAGEFVSGVNAQGALLWSLPAIRAHETTGTYHVGDLVTQAGHIYRALADIIGPKAFTATDWEEAGAAPVVHAGRVAFGDATDDITDDAEFTFDVTKKQLTLKGVTVGPGQGPNGDTSVVFGKGALPLSSPGNHHVAIGHDALLACASGADSIAIGHGAAKAATIGGVIAVGRNALAEYNETTRPDFIIAIGHDAATKHAAGSGAIVIGCDAAKTSTDLGGSIVIGSETVQGGGTLSNSTLIGVGIAGKATACNASIAIGRRVLRNALSVDSCIVLGNSATNILGAADITSGFSPGAYVAVHELTAGNDLTAIGGPAAANVGDKFRTTAIAGIAGAKLKGFAEGSIFIGGGAGVWCVSGVESVVIGNETLGNMGGGKFTSVEDTVILGARSATGARVAMRNSILVGARSLVNASGEDNVVVGGGALDATFTGGSGNTVIGAKLQRAGAMDNTLLLGAGGKTRLEVNPAGNILIGIDALVVNTTGAENVAIGKSALKSAQTINYNVAIGSEAFEALTQHGTWDPVTEGKANIAIGYAAAKKLQSASNSVLAIGSEALRDAVNAEVVTAIGNMAMLSSTSNYSTAIGYQALALSTGRNNVAIGEWAAREVKAVNFLIAIGNDAVAIAATGNKIIGIGRSALSHLRSGADIVAIGYESGDTLFDGTRLTVINSPLPAGRTNITNTVVIGDGGECRFGSNSARQFCVSDRGTAALPSIVAGNAGDDPATTSLTTGIWFPAANEIAFSSNGVQSAKLSAPTARSPAGEWVFTENATIKGIHIGTYGYMGGGGYLPAMLIGADEISSADNVYDSIVIGREAADKSPYISNTVVVGDHAFKNSGSDVLPGQFVIGGRYVVKAIGANADWSSVGASNPTSVDEAFMATSNGAALGAGAVANARLMGSVLVGYWAGSSAATVSDSVVIGAEAASEIPGSINDCVAIGKHAMRRAAGRNSMAVAVGYSAGSNSAHDSSGAVALGAYTNWGNNKAQFCTLIGNTFTVPVIAGGVEFCTGIYNKDRFRFGNNAAGQFAVGNRGSAALPAIVRADSPWDSATTPNAVMSGIYWPADDQLAVSTNGVERVKISDMGLRLPNYAAPPAAAAADEGTVIWDSTAKKVKVFDGTNWLDLH